MYNPPPPVLDRRPFQGDNRPGNGPLPQLDGASDYGDEFMSVPGSPAIWQSYALNRRDNQFVNWDHLGERLMRADPSIRRTIENDLRNDEHDNDDHEHSVYSEIDEVVEPHRQSNHNRENRRSNCTQTDMYDPYRYENSCIGAGSSFFSRHPQRAPGQNPLWGHHQINFHGNPNAGNAPLYAPNPWRGAQVARRARVYRGRGAVRGGRGRGRPGVAHPPAPGPQNIQAAGGNP